jgi:hypothetical protein
MSTYVYVLMQIFRLLLDLLATRRLSDRQKDIEILLLRHELRIMQRKLPNSNPPRISPWDKGVLGVLAAQLSGLIKGTNRRLDEALLLFKPETVLRWY